MEIRRAILLFAIVLGLAALVTSISQPTTSEPEGTRGGASGGDRQEGPAGGTRGEAPRGAADGPKPRPGGEATASRRPSGVSATLRFEAGADPQVRTLRTGRAASLVVEVLAPGSVAIEGLGLDSSALPGTPARFEVLLEQPGRHAISFTPANGADGRTIGVLRVRE